MINTLPEFESRQVLTDDELNWVACYLDSQNRQSRQMLLGSGLLAGLQVRIVNNTVQVTNGIGLSSAGHIIKLQNSVNEHTAFTRQLKYAAKDKEKFAYHYLVDAMPEEDNYAKSVDNPSLYFTGFTGEVLELFEGVVNNTEPINVAALKGKVVVLFQEIIQKELKDCEDDNCQERGKKYQFNTKVLVITKDDALRLLSAEFGLQNANEDSISRLIYPQLHLPNVNILRPVFSNFTVNASINETVLCTEYQRCIKDFVDFISANKNSMDAALTNLKNIASGGKTAFGVVDKLIDLVNKTAVLTNAEKQPRIYQIVYDLLWTWAKAYQELQAEAQKLSARVLGSSAAHPQHVLCGLLDTTNSEFEYPVSAKFSVFRHSFQSRFAQTEQASIQRNISLYINRLSAIIASFDEQIFTGKRELKLIAAGHNAGPLSQQSIPYYLKNEAANFWNSTANHSQLNKYTTRYSQHNEGLNGTAAQAYNLQSSSLQGSQAFYRIEGSHGQPALDALNTVFQIRKKHGLAFEVLMLRLNEKAPYSNSFNYTINEDIESLYQVVRSELKKQIGLNTGYLAGLQIRSNKFESVKSLLIKNLEASYFSFLGTINGILATPLVLELNEAVFASNITTAPKATTFAKTEAKFLELETISNKEKLSTVSMQQVQATQVSNTNFAITSAIFQPAFDFEFVNVLFFNTLGSMVNSIKANAKFKDTTDLSFYTHLYGVAKKLQTTEKGQILFMQSLQLYCALKLQELYLTENFLEFEAATFKTNLETNLLPSCNTISSQLKKLNADFVRTDETLQEIIKGEMLDYADRIKFDDDWVKIIQIDAENKKRNGGLGVENLLDRFVKLHPGMSHGCGVTVGGTYILVYDQANQITADFYLPYIISSHLRPISFTLLEQKTFTLSGKITDEAGAVVITSVLVGSATVLTDNQGFYNALVSENSTVKVLVKADGFATFEQEVKISSTSQTLDIKLKKVSNTKTTTVTFTNQLGVVKTGDISLIDSQNKPVIAKAGTLLVTEAPGTTAKFTVKDAHFTDLSFNIVVGTSNKEEVVKLTEIAEVFMQVTDARGDFDLGLLTRIAITNPTLELDKTNEASGIFTTKQAIDITLSPTITVSYNGSTKTQLLKPDSKNLVKIEDRTNIDLAAHIAILYPPVTVGSGPKIESFELNEKKILINANENLGKDGIVTDGSLLLDSRLKNAPKIKIANLTKVLNTIVLAQAQVILNNVDVTANGQILAFEKAMTAAEIQAFSGMSAEFKLLTTRVDLSKLNHFTLVMNKDAIARLKVLLSV